jgi:hypothetical protein
MELFEKEMKYLHENNFGVIIMKDLDYKAENDYLYVKAPEESSIIGGIASILSKNKSH